MRRLFGQTCHKPESDASVKFKTLFHEKGSNKDLRGKKSEKKIQTLF